VIISYIRSKPDGIRAGAIRDHVRDGSPAGSTPAPGTNGQKPKYAEAGGSNPADCFHYMTPGTGQPDEQRDGFRNDRLVMSINVRRILNRKHRKKEKDLKD